jgi:ankyrin repeat protein
LAAANGHFELLQKLWDWGKKLQLKPEELRNEVLVSKGILNKTACHMAAVSSHVKVSVTVGIA